MAAGDVSDQFFSQGKNNANRYVNPFYGIPLQFLPMNMDQMLWWANHFLARFGFYRTALQKITEYFITDLNIDCDDEESKEEYKDILKQLNWKEKLAECGLDLLAYGNSYVSINQGFNRFLICPQCNKVTIMERVKQFKFDKGKYLYRCPKCAFNGPHECVDKPSKDINKLFIKNWPAKEIRVRHADVSGAAQYFWEIPEEYKQKLTDKTDKFYCKNEPMTIYDAIFEDAMVEFSKKNFLHIKFPTPAGFKTDGRGIPMCIYLFDSFFMLKVLERYNEVICYEDICPFRVISMTNDASPANPILGNQSGSLWAATVDEMISEHRLDPGAYHKFPFPIQYQQLGGEGKTLAPMELIEMAQNNIMNALNVPQEMYKMTLTSQAAGPALRLFENSWACIINAYNKVLQHWGEVIAKIRGLAPAKIALLDSSLADDMEKKSVIGQLVSSNSIARTTFLEMYGIDFKEQLRKKLQEDLDAAEIQEEEQERQQIRSATKASVFNRPGGGAGPAGAAGMGGQSTGIAQAYQGGGGTPQDILQQAQEIAQKLFSMEPHQRRAELQDVKAHNETLWGAAKAQLQKLDQESKSSGHAANKQNAAGGGGGGQ